MFAACGMKVWCKAVDVLIHEDAGEILRRGETRRTERTFNK
jgi:hypothetical protein